MKTDAVYSLTGCGMVHRTEAFRTLKISLVLLFSFILLIATWISSAGAEPLSAQETKRPKIGVVLGGGGAKGAAHIGVLKVMEELKIPVDYIAGTSMGAIVGALYASGLKADKLEKVLTAVDWNDVFSGDPERKDIDFRRKREDYTTLEGFAVGIKNGEVVLPKGLVQDEKVNVLFQTLMLHTSGIDDFDKLPIPYRGVATDLETGEMVVLKSGSLADAARASMSVPGAFPPIELNGRFLIDGGIVRNVPVDIVRGMGADIIICVDVGKPLAGREDLGNPLIIMNQMLDILMKVNVAEQIRTLGPKDVYINPKLGKLGSGDFDKAAEISAIGEKAAREQIKELSRYSVSEAEYSDFVALHHRELVKEVKITSVKVEMESESKISSNVVANRLETKPGATVSIESLKKDAGRVYGMGDFERVDLKVRKKSDGYELVVKAKEKTWGPNYLRVGIALESDFEGWSRYNILVDYTRRWVNRLGAEWKTEILIGSPSGVYSEFYQPLTTKGLFFVSPYIRWRQEPVDIYDNDERVAEYRISRYDVGIDLGVQPWMYGEGRVGLLFTKINASVRTGHVDLPDDSITRGAIFTRAIIDQMDNVNFPNSGYSAGFEFLSSLEDLGSDDEYSKLLGRASGAFSFMNQTLLATVMGGSHIDNELPFYDELKLGGFLNLSGLRENQLRGQHMALGKLITYHKVGQSFFGDLYVGGSLETGNVWQEDFDFDDLEVAGSLFVGYDTIMGPLYVAIGHAGEGRTAGYFYLGRTF